MKLFKIILLYLIFSTRYANADLVAIPPTPTTPLLFQVNGPMITITLENQGTAPVTGIDTSNFTPYFTVVTDCPDPTTCPTGVIPNGTCTIQLTPLLNVSLPNVTTIAVPYRDSDCVFPPTNAVNIDNAILQAGDTWQGGIIYQISQLANANATGTTVAPNVSTGPWSLATCTNFLGGGQNNWTMPTITDLDNIWALSNCNGGVVSGFNCTPNVFYWSSTILNPPPPTNDGSFYVDVKDFGRNCDGADKNIRSHITPCIRTF